MKKNAMNSALQILREANVGSVVNCAGASITILASYKDCHGCCFRTEQKAESCMFRNSCFAHKRPDRKSVIFKSK